MRKLLLATGLTALVWSGCYTDNKEELYPEAGDCDTTNVAFSATIQPILNQNCANSGSCHSSPSPTGGYKLDTYAGAKLSVDLGKLLGSIRHETGFSAMPKGGGKLSDCQIKQIELWVGSGAPNN